MACSGVIRRVPKTAEYAEFIIGPAKGRTRWLFRPTSFTCDPSPRKFKVVPVGTDFHLQGGGATWRKHEKDLRLGSCCYRRALANRRLLLGKIGRSDLW